MAMEIVDLPMKNGGSFHSYVSLPEGTFMNIYIYNLNAESISTIHIHVRLYTASILKKTWMKGQNGPENR